MKIKHQPVASLQKLLNHPQYSQVRFLKLQIARTEMTCSQPRVKTLTLSPQMLVQLNYCSASAWKTRSVERGASPPRMF
jgi:hypothetical protein